MLPMVKKKKKKLIKHVFKHWKYLQELSVTWTYLCGAFKLKCLKTTSTVLFRLLETTLVLFYKKKSISRITEIPVVNFLVDNNHS